MFWCYPGGCAEHTYKEAIPLGTTTVNPQRLRVILKSLESRWSGKDYEILRKNCTHFCQAFAIELGLPEDVLPPYVTRLSYVGEQVDDASRIVAERATMVADKVSQGVNGVSEWSEK